MWRSSIASDKWNSGWHRIRIRKRSLWKRTIIFFWKTAKYIIFVIGIVQCGIKYTIGNRGCGWINWLRLLLWLRFEPIKFFKLWSIYANKLVSKGIVWLLFSNWIGMDSFGGSGTLWMEFTLDGWSNICGAYNNKKNRLHLFFKLDRKKVLHSNEVAQFNWTCTRVCSLMWCVFGWWVANDHHWLCEECHHRLVMVPFHYYPG